MNDLLAGVPLPAADGDVNKFWIKFYAVADASGPLGSDDGTAGTKKRVQHDIAPLRAVEDGIDNQVDRLDGRVQMQQIALLAMLLAQATPTLSFVPAPASQSYGTAIAAGSLDATATFNNATLPGHFAYTTTIASVPGSTVTAGSTVLAVGTYTITATFTPTDTLDFQTVSTTATYTVNGVTPTLSFTPSPASQSYGTAIGSGPLDATAVNASNGNAAVAGHFAYTATLIGSGTPVAITSTNILPVGNYILTAAFTPTDLTDYATPAPITAAYSVGVVTPTISLQTSIAQVFQQNPVTFTATVTSGLGTVTGTVDFLDGSTIIGTGALVNNVATLTTSALAVGTHSITAVYVASGNYGAVASSPAISETIEDFNINFTVTNTTITVAPGGSVTVNFTATPLNATTFPQTIALSLSGLPQGVSYSFSPSALLQGTGSQQVVLTITAPIVFSQLAPMQINPLHNSGMTMQSAQTAGTLATPTTSTARTLAPLALALLLLPFAGRLRKHSRRFSRLLTIAVLVLAGLGATAALTGCGSNPSLYTPTAHSYTVTLTGTSGTLSHSTTFTVTIQ
jgi:hypothetical protein